MFYRILMLSFLLWAGFHESKAQQTFYKSYDIQDGLPTNIIYDIAADELGYLYLATDYGVYVYNGISFKEIPVSKTRASTFTDVHVDYHNRLWGRSFSNDIYIYERDSFRIVNNSIGVAEDLSMHRLFYKDSSIYVNHNLDIYRYNIDYKTLTLVNVKNKNSTEKIWDYIVDNVGNTILKTTTGFIAYDKKGELRTLSITNPLINAMEGKFCPVDKAYQHNILYVPFRQDSFSVFTWNGKDDTLSNLFTIANPSKSKIIRAFQLEEGIIWCVTTAGLYTYDLGKGVLQLILPQNFYCSKIIRSFDGGYWISTIGNGLIYLPSLDITYHPSQAYNANFITLNSLLNKGVVLGTNRGDVLHIDNDCQLVNKYKTPFQDEIQFVYYDSLTARIYHTHGYHSLGDTILKNNINLSRVIKSLDAQNLIAGTWNGAYIMHKDLNKAPTFPIQNQHIVQDHNPIFEHATYLRENRVRCISYDKKKQSLTIGFIDNLVVFDIGNNFKADTIYYDDNKTSIFATTLEERNDTLWVGTFTTGLIAIDKNTHKIIKTYTTANNLPSDNCKRIYIDGDHLWILTFKGLGKLSLLNLQAPILNLNYQYALKNVFITDMAIHKEHLWLTSTKGLLKIKKDYFDKQTSPKLYLHQIKLSGEILPFNDTIILNPSPKDLSIAFDVVAYFSNKDLSYEYKFIGRDTHWHKLERNQQILTFPTLNAGTYDLLLRVDNKEHVSPEDYVQLHIEVLPNFWEQGWFLTALALLILAAIMMCVVYIFKRYLSYFTQKQLMREKLISHQLSALRARMNPHFLYNILSSIQALIYINRKEDAIQVLGNFSQLMRVILEISGKDFISLEKEIDTLQLYTSLEKVRFEKQEDFIVDFQIDAGLDLPNIQIPTLLIQPIIENAIKHGLLHKKGTKVLEVIFKSELYNGHPYLIITVSDNGIGRVASNEINKKRDFKNKHNSFATQAIHQRIQLINYNRPTAPVHIEIKDNFSDGTSMGTTVKVFIPLSDIPFSKRKNATAQEIAQ